MVSGLFRGHAIPQPSQRQIDHALDWFAELLSFDLTLNECADRMGITRGTGCVLYRMLCERYGEAVVG